jgi:hypothetical protein
MITLENLAKEAGVSKAFLYKVLDGYKRSKRSKSNRKIETCQKLIAKYRYGNLNQSGYRRNISKHRGYNKVQEVYDLYLQCWQCNEIKYRKEFLFGPKEVLSDGTRKVTGRCRTCRNHAHWKWRHNPVNAPHVAKKGREAYERSKDYRQAITRKKNHEKRFVPLYKTCPECREEKWYTDFSHGKIKHYPTTDYPVDMKKECRDCRKTHVQKYYKDHLNYFREKKKEETKRMQAEALKLTDKYINRILRGSSLSPMPYGFKYPQWMIEAKRVQLKAERITNLKLKNHYARVQKRVD